MKKIALSFVLATLSVQAAHVVPGDEYLHFPQKKIDFIVAQEYEKEAKEVVPFERKVLQRYEALFGYKLDDTLYLTLASSKNQIANAFSTQVPLNMQINYIGGSLMPDYFATTSWLKTILVHESAHNFQLNAKENPLAAGVYKIFKNTPMTWLYIAPVFPLPNIFESNFMLEGNAVLNESLFGNGGRLYSGAFWAMTLQQARGGYITPERLYNDHLFFPYGTHNYIVGGFFQLFLAQKYGIEKVDHYFKSFSKQWLPFFTNAVCREHFGKNFEDLVQEYRVWLEKEMKDFHESEGEEIAFSKTWQPLNGDSEEIYFLSGDDRSAPSLVRVDKKSAKVTSQKGGFLSGKVFRLDQKYYTLASSKIAPDRIVAGLFDSDGKYLEGTASKALQAVGNASQKYYFDVPHSYNGFMLYKDGKFLDKVNSSVITDSLGNYYFFKQEGAQRTLYRNDRPLYTFEGYYAKVADIDASGRVLFVANSQKGSTLYRLTPQSRKLERLVAGDDVVDAKIVHEDTLLLQVMRPDGIAYVKTKINPIASDIYVRKYFFDTDVKSEKSEVSVSEPVLPKPRSYKPWNNLHYSALAQSVEVSEDDNVNFNVSVSFADPLEQNHLRIFTSSYDDDTITGIGYDNSRYLLRFGFDVYGTLSTDEDVKDRGYGLNAYMSYPLLQEGYRSANIRLDGHLDVDENAKSPLSLSLNWSEKKKFGHSFFADSYKEALAYGIFDRSDISYGGRLTWQKGVGHELYFGTDIHYAKSDTDRAGYHEHGIMIDDNNLAAFYDPSRFVMPSLTFDVYTSEALKTELSLSKVFNFSKYYYSLPLSLRREVVYGKYRYFRLKGGDRFYSFHEYTVGTTLDLLTLHKWALPVSLEWIKNDDLKESNNFRIFFSMLF